MHCIYLKNSLKIFSILKRILGNIKIRTKFSLSTSKILDLFVCHLIRFIRVNGLKGVSVVSENFLIKN